MTVKLLNSGETSSEHELKGLCFCTESVGDSDILLETDGPMLMSVFQTKQDRVVKLDLLLSR